MNTYTETTRKQQDFLAAAHCLITFHINETPEHHIRRTMLSSLYAYAIRCSHNIPTHLPTHTAVIEFEQTVIKNTDLEPVFGNYAAWCSEEQLELAAPLMDINGGQ